MLRLLVTSLVAACLACAAAGAATPDPTWSVQSDDVGHSIEPGECAHVTFVATDAEELYFDVYVAKSGSVPQEPPSGDDEAFVQEAIDAALEYIETRSDGPPGSSDVQIEFVWPKNDANPEGYRVALLVDLRCG